MSAPKNHWKVRENHRLFLDKVAQKFRISQPKEWGFIRSKDIHELAGRGFLLQHKGSLFNALRFSYPEIEWRIEWLSNVPRNYWANNRENQRAFLQQFATMHNISSPTEWYRVNTRELIKAGGIAILKQHGYSLFAALKYCFPEIEWNMNDFRSFPKNYWSSKVSILLHDWNLLPKENQRIFLEEFAKANNIKNSRDWGHISRHSLLESGGYSLLAKYSSLFDILRNVFEEIQWKREWFPRIPKYKSKHWEIQGNQLQFLNILATDNNIRKENDWNRVSISLVRKSGGQVANVIFLTQNLKGLLNRYNGSLLAALKSLYPLGDWENIFQFSPSTLVSKTHKEIHSVISEIFPHSEFAYNFRKINSLL